jgi:hypothetical protein
LFLTITHRNPFVPIKFPESSHQILLVPLNKPSISLFLIKFSKNSHQILLVPSITHQYPFVLIKFPSNSPCPHQVPIKILLFPWLWRIGR